MPGWFTAMAVYIVQIGDDLTVRTHRNLYAFHASGFESAFEKALILARKEEEEFENGFGELVSWRLVEIETLDFVGKRIRDGWEIYSEPGPDQPVTDFTFPLRPELSEPTETGIAAQEVKRKRQRAEKWKRFFHRNKRSPARD
jgi:hypothetical protein